MVKQLPDQHDWQQYTIVAADMIADNSIASWFKALTSSASSYHQTSVWHKRYTVYLVAGCLGRLQPVGTDAQWDMHAWTEYDGVMC
jgi:hypothetical protein